MSEINKHPALRALEVMWQGGEDTVAEEVIHPDYHNHEEAADRPGGPGGVKETARRLRRVFADLQIQPLDVVAERDKVVVRACFSGRQVGPYAAALVTGRKFSVEHTHGFRVLDGMLLEHWATQDDAGMPRQLGLLTIGGGANAASAR